MRNGELAPGPGIVLGAVVGGIHDDGVVGDAQLVELGEQLANLLVVGDHPVSVVVLPALAAVLVGEVGPEVHGRRIVPKKEWLLRLGLLLHPGQSTGGDLFVDGFHPLLGQRAGIRYRLSALAVGQAVENAARSKLLLEFRILGIVRQFRLFLGVEVIEIAEKFIEAVHTRQIFVAIAQVVLAELTGGVAERLQQFGDRRIFRVQSDHGAGHADFGQAGADRVLTGDEGRSAGRAALLAVPIGESRAFLRDPVDVWGLVAHHTLAVVADVPIADIVSPNDEDVWFVELSHAILLWLICRFQIACSVDVSSA
jgi:hypothetical protein